MARAIERDAESPARGRAGGDAPNGARAHRTRLGPLQNAPMYSRPGALRLLGLFAVGRTGCPQLLSDGRIGGERVRSRAVREAEQQAPWKRQSVCKWIGRRLGQAQ